MRKIITASLFISLLGIFACNSNAPLADSNKQNTLNFNENILLLKENNHTKKVRGQLLYMPIYSNVPYKEFDRKFDLSAFVAIHNTDLKHSIRITKVMFFNNDGKMVADYLPKDTTLNALAATNFFIPERDQSGTGANFLVEWVSDTLVNEPLIETVMLGLASGQGISFSSPGKVIRELK